MKVNHLILENIGEVELLQEYLHLLEDFLEKESQKSHERLQLLLEEVRAGKTSIDADTWNEEDDVHVDLEMTSHFAQLLRTSYFISLYAFCESGLESACDALRDENLPPLQNTNGTGIDRAKKYLINQLGVGFLFDTNPKWREIKSYQNLRNCIVHNAGKLNKQFRNESSLRSYVVSKPTISLSGENIVLSKDFCTEATQIVGEFFRALFASLD